MQTRLEIIRVYELFCRVFWWLDTKVSEGCAASIFTLLFYHISILRHIPEDHDMSLVRKTMYCKVEYTFFFMLW